MKRPLFVLLMMTCSVAWADWELLVEDSERKTIWHVDKSTIQTRNSVAKIQFMISYLEGKKTKEGQSYQSVIINEKFNCLTNKASLSSAITFSELYGEGTKVTKNKYDAKKEQWDPIVPLSFEEELLKIACSKE